MGKAPKTVMVMPTNNSGKVIRWLAHRYPCTLGHLYSPEGRRGPWREFPYALDNGCFKRWDPNAFRQHLLWAHGKTQQPRWVVVPDVVGDWEQTKLQWRAWAPWIKQEYQFPLALAVQDGSTPTDVLCLDPAPDVIFMGGTTGFKWGTVARWCSTFPRVHVGRVNSPEKLWELRAMGAESCDGTGWFRGDRAQLLGLVQFLRRRKPQRFVTMFDE
jgi:hypothetical protein